MSTTRSRLRSLRLGSVHPDDDIEHLLAFYDYPAEHWIHLRTTNPIESTVATVRHRTKVTKGPGSKATCTAMAFKLIEAAQHRWRAVNAPHLVGPPPSRSNLREGQARRTRGFRSPGRREHAGDPGRPTTMPHPQVLTIAR